jgi:dienelactone hydrolase
MAESGIPAHAAAPAAVPPPPRPGAQATRLHIVVPDRPLVDDPAGTVIRGCVPGQVVTVTASFRIDGFVHEATAAFTPDEDGSVDTARDASVAGSYTGIDPFGLWWSGTPARPAAHPPSPPEPVACRLTAEAAGMAVTAGFQRHWLTGGASVTEVDQPGVTGIFARPAGPGPFPGVVAFGGSGGGLGPAAAWAPMLASRGIATLAIAYFGAPGLPAALTGVEVEVVERAARWLLSRADIAPGTVAAMGMSRGSELALWAGALLDVIGAVVAFAPSGISWPGIDSQGPTASAAWTFRGRPLPYATVGAAAKAAQAPRPGPPAALRAVFEPTLADARLFEHAVIPVEEIRGPVLFVSGEADTMWPATQMTQIAEQRARDRGFRHPLVHLRYRDGGHICAGVPGTPVATEVKHHPLTGGRYSFGGTRAANARARADSWPRVVAFLRVGAPGKPPGPADACVSTGA